MGFELAFSLLTIIVLCYPICGELNENQSDVVWIPCIDTKANDTNPIPNEVKSNIVRENLKLNENNPNIYNLILIFAALLMVALSLIALMWIANSVTATNKEGLTAIIRLDFADVFIAVVGLALQWIIKYKGLLVIIPIILAYVTFFGFMSISRALGGELALNKAGMRGAITVTVIVVYFFIVSMAIFNKFEGDIPPYMQTMTENFTTTMGIVVAFYFGASAYVQTHEKSKEKDT